MKAYSGGKADTAFGTYVFDLAGMTLPKRSHAVLYQHAGEEIVGWSTEDKSDGKTLMIAGIGTKSTDAGKKVFTLGKKGFPWQSSVGLAGADADIEIVEEGEVKINGQVFAAPVQVIRKSVLREASFVSVGADGETDAKVFSVEGSEKMAKDETKPSNEGTAPDPIAEERKRAKALREAFPEDPAFALQQIEAGASVIEAKAAYCDVLRTRKPVERETVPASRFVPAETSTEKPTGAAGDQWRAKWRETYESERKIGADDKEAREKATLFMLTKDPGLTAEFVSAFNSRKKEAQ